MTRPRAKTVFADIGPNFMTPEVIEYGWVSQTVAYELSEGTGFDRQPIYGVTFRNSQTREMDHERSQCVHSLTEARELIETVISELR